MFEDANQQLGGKRKSRAYDFLKKCGYFYVLTINDEFPAGRPFGAVMEYNDMLYISTSNENEAHKQLRKNGNIQILAKKEGTREWLRITGKAMESTDAALKQRMLDERPVLSKHFSSPEADNYLLFQIDVLETEFH